LCFAASERIQICTSKPRPNSNNNHIGMYHVLFE